MNSQSKESGIQEALWMCTLVMVATPWLNPLSILLILYQNGRMKNPCLERDLYPLRLRVVHEKTGC